MTPEEARKHRAVLSPEHSVYWCYECNQEYYSVHGYNNRNRTGISDEVLLAACYPTKLSEPPSQPGYYFVKIASASGVGAMWDESWAIGEYRDGNYIDLCGSDEGFNFGETGYSMFRITEIRGPIELPKD